MAIHAYEQYFGLREHPFSITPDPRFVYLSDIHRAALEHLRSGATGGVNGFVLLTGDVGTGKTTICRTFLADLPPKTEVALILNPVLTLNEFLQAICDELDLVVEGSRKSNKNLIDHLNRFLLQVYAVGQKTILIVDEAQNLSQELLEQIRLLTNLETSTDKLLQIFLIGQPELRDMLNRPEMVQVSQRITSRYHLGPLGPDDVQNYIERRLEVAGAADLEFAPSAMRRIHAFSKGVPRVINVLCDKVLACAYDEGVEKINSRIVKEAESRVLGNMPKGSTGNDRGRLGWLALTGALVVVISVLVSDLGGLRSWIGSQLADSGQGSRLILESPPQVQNSTPPTAAPTTSMERTDAPRDTAASGMQASPPSVPIEPLPADGGRHASALEPAITETAEASGSDADAISEAQLELPPAGRLVESPDPQEATDGGTVVAEVTGSAETETTEPRAPASELPQDKARQPEKVVAPPQVAESQPAPQPVPPPASAPAEAAPSSTTPLTRSETPPPPVAAGTAEQSLVDYTRSYSERKMLSMWGVDETQAVGLDFCKTAQGFGMRCLNEEGGLRKLNLYDRPAMIFLTIDNVSSYAVVLKASAESVVLDVLDQKHEILASSLNNVWDGSFLLLWKPPQNMPSILQQGVSGSPVLWLRRAIDRIEGVQTTGAVFDAQLAARIRSFQRSVGLVPDGIVGPRTFILLQNRLTEPRG